MSYKVLKHAMLRYFKFGSSDFTGILENVLDMKIIKTIELGNIFAFRCNVCKKLDTSSPFLVKMGKKCMMGSSSILEFLCHIM